MFFLDGKNYFQCLYNHFIWAFSFGLGFRLNSTSSQEACLDQKLSWMASIYRKSVVYVMCVDLDNHLIILYNHFIWAFSFGLGFRLNSTSSQEACLDQKLSWMASI